MKIVILVIGILSVLLGGLWLLQGLGAVSIPPLLCFANCEPIDGPAPTWTIIGLLVVAAGILAILHALRRGPRQ